MKRPRSAGGDEGREEKGGCHDDASRGDVDTETERLGPHAGCTPRDHHDVASALRPDSPPGPCTCGGYASRDGIERDEVARLRSRGSPASSSRSR